MMRVGEGQRAQQEGIDYSEDGDICANGERENEDGNDGKASVAAEGAKGEMEVPKGVSPVVGETAATVHVLSYALAHVLDGEKISKLEFGFFAGVFGTPALGDKVVHLGFEMKAQLIFHVCRRIETQQALVSPP